MHVGRLFTERDTNPGMWTLFKAVLHESQVLSYISQASTIAQLISAIYNSLILQYPPVFEQLIICISYHSVIIQHTLMLEQVILISYHSLIRQLPPIFVQLIFILLETTLLTEHNLFEIEVCHFICWDWTLDLSREWAHNLENISFSDTSIGTILTTHAPATWFPNENGGWKKPELRPSA